MPSLNELYIGPSGSGKSAALSDYLLKEAHENPERNYLLIVPDQCASACEKKLLRRNEELFGFAGLLNVDILGTGRLCYRILSEFGIMSDRVLEEYERSLMVRAASAHVRNDLELYKGSVDRTGFIQEMKSCLSELTQFGITSEDLQSIETALRKDGTGSLAAKLHDIRIIMDDMYERYLSGYGMELPEERMRLAGRLLALKTEVCKAVDGAVIAFDEFRGFTPDQFGLIASLSGRAEKLIFSITIDVNMAKKNEVKEYELGIQSFETLARLREILPSKSVEKYFNRGTALSRFASSDSLAFLEENIFRFPFREYDKKPSDIELWRTNTQNEEAAVIAEDIRRSVQNGMRYRDIAVITGDIEGFSEYAEKIFSDYDIPYFLDMSRRFTANPFSEGIISLLKMIEKDFSYETVFGFLRLGLIPMCDEGDIDRLENYILQYGIRGRSRWEKEIELPSLEAGRNEKHIAEIREDLEAAERARKVLFKAIQPVLGLTRGMNKVGNVIDALKKVYGREYLGVEELIDSAAVIYHDMGKYPEEQALLTLFSKLMEYLDDVSHLLGEEELKLHDITELLSTGMNDISLGVIPPTLDAVIIGDPERTRLHGIKTLYFANMNEGIIPSAPSSGKLLSDRDKDRIDSLLLEAGTGKALAPNGRVRGFMETFYIYQTMTAPSERLVMTFAERNRASDSMEMSYIAGRVMRCFPQLSIEKKEVSLFAGTQKTDFFEMAKRARRALDILKEDGDELPDELIDELALLRDYGMYPESGREKDAFLYDNRPDPLPQELMRNLDIDISVSKLEKYAGCPYSFYLRYILRLNERHEKKLDALNVGNIMHRALELAGTEIKKKYNNDWKSLTEADMNSLSSEALRISLEEAKLTYTEDDARSAFLLDELHKLMDRTVHTMKYQISKGKLLPEAFEQRFTATFRAKRPDGEELPVTINGIIDRVDILNDDNKLYVRVIDYKTGNKHFEPKTVREGTDLQLPVYMDILMELLRKKYGRDKEIIPAGMYYYHVASPVIKDIKAGVIKEAAGDMSLAAEMSQIEELRLRGAVNTDDEKTHQITELQEEGIVSDEGAFKKGRVVPISLARASSDEVFSKDTVAVGTDTIEGICDFAGRRMEEEASEILSGKIDKRPIRYGISGKVLCEWCEYREVCRFDSCSGRVNFIPDSPVGAGKEAEKMAESSKVKGGIDYDRVE